MITLEIGWDLNGFVVNRIGTAGGMTLWWKEDMEIRILHYSDYHIDAEIEEPISSRFTLFYDSPYSQLRQHSWNLLRRLASMSVKPWLVVGDFNEICFSWERRSGRIKGE